MLYRNSYGFQSSVRFDPWDDTSHNAPTSGNLFSNVVDLLESAGHIWSRLYEYVNYSRENDNYF